MYPLKISCLETVRLRVVGFPCFVIHILNIQCDTVLRKRMYLKLNSYTRNYLHVGCILTSKVGREAFQYNHNFGKLERLDDSSTLIPEQWMVTLQQRLSQQQRHQTTPIPPSVSPMELPIPTLAARV